MEKETKLSGNEDEEFNNAESHGVSNRHSSTADLANLRSWFEDYCTAYSLDRKSPGMSVLENDVLDLDLIEKRVSSLASGLPSFDYFCGPCQTILANWPVDLDQVDKSETFENMDWHDTFYVEAAARRGCRFCSFMMQVLVEGRSLHIFRCLETRLEALGELTRSTICVNVRKMVPNYPGRTDKIWYHPHPSIAVVRLESNGLIPASKPPERH